MRGKLAALERQYATFPKARECHPDIGDWWTLYDYGLEAVKGWSKDYKHPYPGLIELHACASKLHWAMTLLRAACTRGMHAHAPKKVETMITFEN